MARVEAGALPWSRPALVAVAGAVVVWYVGFDPFWAIAAGMATAAVGAGVASLGDERDPAWAPPGYEAPPGIRRDVAAIAGSLAACDRLARPRVARRIRALLIPEREDRVASTTVTRRMHALLAAALNDRGLDPDDPLCDEAAVALLGRDAIAILHPSEERPVTTAAVERCLEAVERLGTENRRAP